MTGGRTPGKRACFPVPDHWSSFMTVSQNILAQLSGALAAQTAAAGRLIVAIRLASGRHLSAILWQPDVIVTSEQSLPQREDFEVVAAGGAVLKAQPAGRDPGTNVAALRLANSIPPVKITAAEAHTGALALAHGADGSGRVRARLGVVNSVGPEWHSRAGGRIDQRIVLDIQLSRAEEGGPVLDATGALLGMSTLGPPGQVLVIPTATIERVVPALLRDGHISRGWLGMALQPVAVPDALREMVGQRSGMMVMSIVEGGPAANAGVMAGDILLTIDGVPARRINKLGAHLDADRIGQGTELRLIRSGAVIALEAIIAARPAA
jgi:S1-C subfamily serine protease